MVSLNIFKYMNINMLSSQFKALGHPIRLNIALGLLSKDNCDVSTMQDHLSIRQATLSQHLAVLKHAGIVSCQRSATRMCYSVSDKNIVRLLKAIRKGEKS